MEKGGCREIPAASVWNPYRQPNFSTTFGRWGWGVGSQPRADNTIHHTLKEALIFFLYITIIVTSLFIFTGGASFIELDGYVLGNCVTDLLSRNATGNKLVCDHRYRLFMPA